MNKNPGRVGTQAWLLALVLVSLLGTVLIAYHTRNGAGASGDSVQYVQGALNMLAGRGYSRFSGGGEAVPITGFPPVFPAALALTGLFTGDLFNGGRILNALLFGLTIYFSGFLVWRLTRSGLAALLASLLILTATNLVRVYAWVMSEGLFITLMLAALILFIYYLESSSRLLLIGSSLMIILASLTRFVGLSLVPAVCLVILLASRKRFKGRLLDCLIVGAVTMLPFYAWLQRNAALAGTMTNRELVYHPMSRELLQAFISEMVAWFIPRQIPLPLEVKALILLPLLALAGWQIWETLMTRIRQPESFPRISFLPLLLVLLILAYLAILVLNTTFLDSSTSTEAAVRYLTPVFVITGILVVGLGHQVLKVLPAANITRPLAVLVAMLVIGVYGYRTVNFIHEPGPVFGYTDFRRANAELVSELTSLEDERLLLSNNVELTYFLAGRPAYALPILFDHYKQQYRPDYTEQLSRANSRLEQGALVVIFGESDSDEIELLQLLQVKPAGAYNGVSIYSR